MIKRVFIIVFDSFGIGELPDAELYGDSGSNTLLSVSKSVKFNAPILGRLGLFNIDGVEAGKPENEPIGCYARLSEKSAGKDTVTGHWEIAGLVSEKSMPTFPNGFPESVIKEFERVTGRKTLCNLPYSGTEVIADYGLEHVKTGSPIVYTSADSVFQIAAHEEVIPLDELYDICRKARKLLTGDFAVGRVIARPFIGEYPDFKRTANRHDYSLEPPGPTLLDLLKEKGLETIAIGKINDIFAGKGITHSSSAKSNLDAMTQTVELLNRDFNGLCFVNLVDFDMLYGHRNDIDGYAEAVSEADEQLEIFMRGMREEDLLIVTADHGCDPGTESTDHSREYVPLLMFGESIKSGVNLGTRETFADISATVLEIFSLDNPLAGNSVLSKIIKTD